MSKHNDNGNHGFKPAWWLYNGHLQTIWPVLTRRKLKVKTQRERLELPDGDFIDLAWTGPEGSPIILVLHGIAGCLDSPYAQGILHTITECKWRGLFMHFRGCSGCPNRLARFYHSGETGDLNFLINEIRRREPNTPLAAIGFSLGGNVLLKWLAENTEQNPLAAAVAVSVPFELKKAATRLNKGLSKFYQWWLLRELRQLVKGKFQHSPSPIDFGNIDKLRSFLEFDDKVTAPLHGFADGNDYYHRASTRNDLKQIHVPTLILQALDDPFLTPDANPNFKELSQHITLELLDSGGHVGFIAGTLPWQPVYWLENRIAQYLSEHLSLQKSKL